MDPVLMFVIGGCVGLLVQVELKYWDRYREAQKTLEAAQEELELASFMRKDAKRILAEAREHTKPASIHQLYPGEAG